MLRRHFSLLALLAPLARTQQRSGRVIIVLGPPGAGKSTQAEKLARRLGVSSISASQLLKRSTGWRKSDRKRILAALESGLLVTDDTLIELFHSRLRRETGRGGFILDGYPGNPKHAAALEKFLTEYSLPQPWVLLLQVPDAVVVQRMQARRRADDTPELIQSRLTEYRSLEAELIGYYPKERVIPIDGARSEPEVTAEIEAKLPG